ncbi:cilia- and flagella-associated protein 68-like [Sycon ciliatum]|uniref:cilia- and flagella-associated protein 68-like n=1 Tax=Sycon ciliatum TaxID=27933 RepID=UPI0020AEB18A|eukprot:scpid91204/ scgid9610/ UPF0686 protein C11orf1 homolog
MDTTLPFQSSVQATTQGEIWDHTDTKKFEQFGWRTTKNDERYRTGAGGALMGNWVEDRQDVRVRAREPTLPAQTSHYFQSTYDKSFGKRDQPAPDCLKAEPAKREVRAFPCHQPELDPPFVQANNNSYKTSNQAYGSHKA